MAPLLPINPNHVEALKAILQRHGTTKELIYQLLVNASENLASLMLKREDAEEFVAQENQESSPSSPSQPDYLPWDGRRGKFVRE